MLIDALPKFLFLGMQDELNVTSLVFDVTEWLNLYPLGVLNITYIRPGDAAIYPVEAIGVSLESPVSTYLTLATVDDKYTLTWKVSDAVTYVPGEGSIVVNLKVNGTIKKKSYKITTIIADGHAAAGDPPEPLADYIEKWSAVDLTLTEIDVGEELTQSVTQNGTGTHIALQVHKGAKVASAEFDGNDVLFTLDDLSEVRIVGGKTAVTGAPGVDGDTPVKGVDYFDGDDGTNAYVHIKYSATEPTADGDMTDTPSAWMGVYSGASATAPTAYTSFNWYRINGNNEATWSTLKEYTIQMEAAKIRANAGIPAGITAGIEDGVTVGLVDANVLVDADYMYAGDANPFIAAKSSGEGTASDPYVIANKLYDNSESANWALLWQNYSNAFYVKYFNCSFDGYPQVINCSSDGYIIMENCEFTNISNAVVYCGQGARCSVTMSKCHFGEGIKSGVVAATFDATSTVNIVVDNCLFDDVWAAESRGVFLGGNVRATDTLSITNCDFSGPDIGVYITTTHQDSITIENCKFRTKTAFVRYAAGLVSSIVNFKYLDIAGSDDGLGAVRTENGGGLIDSEISYCTFGNPVTKGRLLSFLNSVNVEVHHCKATNTVGDNDAGSECFEAWTSENISFHDLWVTACAEDAFEFVKVTNSVMYNLVGDNVPGQIVDNFDECEENLIRHIYGSGAEVIKLTDAKNCKVHDIYATSTHSTNGLVTLENIYHGDAFTLGNIILAPLTPMSRIASGEAITGFGTLGDNYGIYYDENGDVVTYGNVEDMHLSPAFIL